MKGSHLVLSALVSVARAATAAGAVPYNWTAYEIGDLGQNPHLTYQTSTVTAPILHFFNSSESKGQSGGRSTSRSTSQTIWAEDEYILMTPRSERTRSNKALLLDRNGDLVWYQHERGAVYDLRVQKFKGESYLTYWVGDDDFFGHGRGYYKMLDSSYHLAYTVAAGNELEGDYHDFSLTSSGTAIISAYVAQPWDLTDRGRDAGYIWDCVFQEVAVESGEVLFEWRASHHFNFTDMAVSSWVDWTGHEGDPWDWFHLNSVVKDTQGNYLIAARYTNAITYINGRTGAILWNLGGKESRFTDRSDGNATLFTDPHTARWYDEGRHVLAVFDNVAHWSRDLEDKMSYGATIKLNMRDHSATVQTQYLHPEGFWAESEGSIQVLSNGNVFIGYGSASVLAEFDIHGDLLTSAHISPLHTNGTANRPGQGFLTSFRTAKHRWAGYPEQTPAIRIDDDVLHVSWNGATQLRRWRLDGRRTTKLHHIGTFAKTGFETSFHIDSTRYSSYQLTALGVAEGAASHSKSTHPSDDSPIRSWNILPEGIVTELVQQDSSMFTGNRTTAPTSNTGIPWWMIAVCIVVIVHANKRYLPGLWSKVTQTPILQSHRTSKSHV